jgi:Rrf2 family protein
MRRAGKSANGASGVEARRPLLYSRTCQLALRAMERLAAAAPDVSDGLISQSALSRAAKVSAASLAQILHRLRNAGLIVARRGPRGGVGLARAARDIAVLEIIRAIDGAGIEGRCVLGFSECSDATPCPAHPVWKPAKDLLARQLENRSLHDLVRSVDRKRARAERRRPSLPGSR